MQIYDDAQHRSSGDRPQNSAEREYFLLLGGPEKKLREGDACTVRCPDPRYWQKPQPSALVLQVWALERSGRQELLDGCFAAGDLA